MGTRIGESRITSTHTAHFAWKALPWQGGGWAVTFLPDSWSRSQAITAITAAETFAYWVGLGLDRETAAADRWWPHWVNWAGELGLTADEMWSELADTYPPTEES